MLRIVAALLAAALSLAGTAAHAATPQTIVQSIEVNADPEAVWAAIGAFDSAVQWHPLVASSPATLGNDVGSVRTVTLKEPGSPKILEELTAYNPRMQMYEYKIDSNPQDAAPVTNCTVRFHVGIGKHHVTKIVWTAHFLAADGVTAGHASDVMNRLFRVGLENVKHMAED
jgi:mxaD protein